MTGYGLASENDLWEAEYEYLRMIAALKKDISRGNFSLYPKLARAYGYLASIYSKATLFSEEENALNHSLRIWRELAVRNDKDYLYELAGVYQRLGTVYKYQGKWKETEMVLVRAREILSLMSRSDMRMKAELVRCNTILGNVYWLTGRLGDAERELLLTIRLCDEASFDLSDMLLESLGFAHARLAEIYRKKFDVAESTAHMFHSIKLYSRMSDQAGIRRIVERNYDFLIDLYQCTGRNTDELLRRKNLIG